MAGITLQTNTEVAPGQLWHAQFASGSFTDVYLVLQIEPPTDWGRQRWKCLDTRERRIEYWRFTSSNWRRLA